MKLGSKQEIHLVDGWTYVIPVDRLTRSELTAKLEHGFGQAAHEDLANYAAVVIDNKGVCRKNAAGAWPQLEETFEFTVPFKDPDGCGEFAYWADKERREVAIAEAITAEGLDGDDEDTLEVVEQEVIDRLYDDPESTNKRFFEHGEYGTVELKLKRDGTGWCKLVPR